MRVRRPARLERDPAGMPAHAFDDEAARVGRRGGADAVYAFHGDVRRGVEPEGKVCAGKIVVDGLGNADDVYAVFLAQKFATPRYRPP